MSSVLLTTTRLLAGAGMANGVATMVYTSGTTLGAATNTATVSGTTPVTFDIMVQ